MNAEKSKTKTPGLIRPATVVLLVLCTLGGVYAGMHWHTSAASTGPAASESSKLTESKQQLWTCSMHPQVIQDHPGDCPICHMKLVPLATPDAGGTPATAMANESAGATVTIDPTVVQNMGVRTATVTEGPLDQRIRVSAMIAEPEPGHLDINLRVSGWIQTLYANVDGMELKKGDPLFDLYSPELRLAIEELISARKSAKSSSNDADAILHETSAGLAAAAESRLIALGLTQEQVAELGTMNHAPSVVTFLSPINAHVIEKAGVYAGSSVTAGQRIFRLAQRDPMWVEGRVPEGKFARVHVGQHASARIDAYPGRSFDGEVIFIHPHFDEMTRTGMIRMALGNHDHTLHEGMYATVDIDVGLAEPAVLAPREAIIDSGQSQMVFVSLGEGRFEPRHVVVGQPGEHGMVQILSGLKTGETVVASGQFLLDSESHLREAIAKFLSQKSASANDMKDGAVVRPLIDPKGAP